MIPAAGAALALVCLLGASASAFAQASMRVAGHDIPPGQRADFSVTVPAGETDPATFIPVTVLNGERPGPVLLVTAGVHGYEFAPILAAEAFVDAVDPAHLSGTVIVVRIANVSAFEQRVPYVSPFDMKNLNRSFPGSATGTQTERVAWALSTSLIPQADFVIDVHSGDGAEWLEAFVGVYGGALATDYDGALAVARAFAFGNIVRYRMDTQEQVDRGRSLNRQAVAQGLPTVLVEIGENGRRDPTHVAAIVSGLKNALGVLGISAETPTANNTPHRYYDETASVPVRHSGLWTPVRTGGRAVQEGEILGVIRDYTGRVVETVVSPMEGFALYGLAGPPVRAGDSVVTIARPAPPPDPAPR